VEARGPEVALQQGIDKSAGVFVVHDGYDELHGAEHSPRSASLTRPADRRALAIDAV
jgi:hypothetical protein